MLSIPSPPCPGVEARPRGAGGQQGPGQGLSPAAGRRCAHLHRPCAHWALEVTQCVLCEVGRGEEIQLLTQGTSEERLSTCPPLSLARPHGLSGRPCQLHPHGHESYTHNGGSPGDTTSHPHGAQSRVSPCPNSEKSGPPGRAVRKGTPRPADSTEQGSSATHRTLRAAVRAWVSARPSPY